MLCLRHDLLSFSPYKGDGLLISHDTQTPRSDPNLARSRRHPAAPRNQSPRKQTEKQKKRAHFAAKQIYKYYLCWESFSPSLPGVLMSASGVLSFPARRWSCTCTCVQDVRLVPCDVRSCGGIENRKKKVCATLFHGIPSLPERVTPLLLDPYRKEVRKRFQSCAVHGILAWAHGMALGRSQ
jgi:hypothetical protein